MRADLSAAEFAIAGRPIGPGHPVYVVAEISANHHQDLGTARALVRAAAAAGADAVKLQTYTPDTITLDARTERFRIRDGTIWGGRVLHDLYREAQTPWHWHQELAALAADVGLHLFSTPFDSTAVAFLETLGVPAYKVASFELVDIPLLRVIAATGKPMILSTGMATLDEIDEAVRTVRASGGGPLALLRASSAYPAPQEEMDLQTIGYLARVFGVVAGISDHTLGVVVPVTAVALGAHIVEKHLTMSRAIPGPDSAFSLEPAEFKAMVDAVRAIGEPVVQATPPGTPAFGPTEHERPSLQFRRSLFVVQDVRAGEAFAEENVRSIRPSGGLHTRHLDEVLGRRATRDIARGTPLAWDMLECLSLRPAEDSDRLRLFEWANDPITRANSFAPLPISWSAHCSWFEALLADAMRVLYIVVTEEGEGIGQVRLDPHGPRESEISISLAPAWRGRGIGARAIRMATDLARRHAGSDAVHAYVKADNEASRKVFARAGFVEVGAVDREGCATVHLVHGLSH